jgi:hypothetical protein
MASPVVGGSARHSTISASAAPYLRNTRGSGTISAPGATLANRRASTGAVADGGGLLDLWTLHPMHSEAVSRPDQHSHEGLGPETLRRVQRHAAVPALVAS